MSVLLRLEVFHQGELLKEVPWDGETLWVGRGEECGIRLDDRAISRKHAVLRHTENGFEFEKKSKFGDARMDGRDVEQLTLHGGECLSLGSYEIHVKRPDGGAVPEKAGVAVESAIELNPAPVEDAPVSEGGAEFPLPVSESPSPENQTDENPFGQKPDGATALIDPSSEQDPVLLAGVDSGNGGTLPNPNEFGGTDVFRSPENAQAEGGTQGGSSGAFDFSRQDPDGATRISKRDRAQTKPVLEFGDPDEGGRVYEMVDSEIAIGRAASCHVILEDKKSSRKHVVILKQDGQWVLKDLGSANGTLVNGQRVDEHVLVSGDEIRVGDTRFKFKMFQAGYESKKAEFLQIPVEPESAFPAPPLPGPGMASPPSMITPFESFVPGDARIDHKAAAAVPDFAAPAEDKRSGISKMLDRYRAMPVRMQIIYGAVGIAAFYFLLYEEDEVVQKGRIQPAAQVQKKVDKKDPKKKLPGMPAFESLTPEQQAYVDSQYKISLENFKNREYDSCLLELGKIFAIVQDYKEAREVEALAREKKRQLEAQEEERKRKEQERQAQMKIQALIDQAGLLMDQKKYKEAEALFPEIELLQPENSVVANWRKRILEENEAIEKSKEEAAKLAKREKEIQDEYLAARKTLEEKDYFAALDQFDALLEKEGLPQKLVTRIKADIRTAEDAIAQLRDPLLEKGKKLEKEENYTDAYNAYLEASKVDPTDTEAPAGMSRIRGVITNRAKAIYSEAVIAESFSDFDVAEKKYREVLEVVPVDNEYFTKATTKIKKLAALRRLSGEGEKK